MLRLHSASTDGLALKGFPKREKTGAVGEEQLALPRFTNIEFWAKEEMLQTEANTKTVKNLRVKNLYIFSGIY